MAYLQCIAGLVLLGGGADLFVRAAGADAGTGISFVKNGWTALYFVAPLVLVALGATAFYVFSDRKREGTVPDGDT